MLYQAFPLGRCQLLQQAGKVGHLDQHRFKFAGYGSFGGSFHPFLEVLPAVAVLALVGIIQKVEPHDLLQLVQDLSKQFREDGGFFTGFFYFGKGVDFPIGLQESLSVLGIIGDGLVFIPKTVDLLIEAVHRQVQPESLLSVGGKGRAVGFLQAADDFPKDDGSPLWVSPRSFKYVGAIFGCVVQNHFYFLLFWRKTQKVPAGLFSPTGRRK